MTYSVTRNPDGKDFTDEETRKKFNEIFNFRDELGRQHNISKQRY